VPSLVIPSIGYYHKLKIYYFFFGGGGILGGGVGVGTHWHDTSLACWNQVIGSSDQTCPGACFSQIINSSAQVSPDPLKPSQCHTRSFNHSFNFF
jgi:hypothetical protein